MFSLSPPRGLVMFASALALAAMLSIPCTASAQQFVGDNQWVAPHGVATITPVVGSEYSQFIFVAALLPEWEFNFSASRFYDDPLTGSEAYDSYGIWAKYRIFETEAGNGGYSVVAGTGNWPDHIVQGSVASAGESYWANLTATYALFDDRWLLDLLPGFTLNLDNDRQNETAWGFTWASRSAIYGVIPKTAIMAEVFGTAGEAFVEPSYRAGLRFEPNDKFTLTLTYTDAFDGSSGGGVELGAFYFTEPRFCFGGCRK